MSTRVPRSSKGRVKIRSLVKTQCSVTLHYSVILRCSVRLHRKDEPNPRQPNYLITFMKPSFVKDNVQLRVAHLLPDHSRGISQPRPFDVTYRGVLYTGYNLVQCILVFITDTPIRNLTH